MTGFEQSAEMTQIIKTGLKAYLRYRFQGVHQQSARGSQPRLTQILHRCESGMIFKEPMKIFWRHRQHLRQRIDIHIFLKMRPHIIDNLPYAPGVQRQFSAVGQLF